MYLLEAQGLYFRYQRDWVLSDISFDLSGGEFVGLIGPNGSGKSTLLKILNGLLRPQRGQVFFQQRGLDGWSRRLLAQKMGLVAQEIVPDFPFTLLELVLMGRYPHLGPLQFEGERDLEIARRALSLVDLGGLQERRLMELSGGERQRALVARALSQEPVCLLMDEPTAFLDLRHQLDLFSLASRLVRHDGLGALVVSHDVNLAAEFCDRLLLLDRGRIVVQGAPEEVVRSECLEPVYGCRLLVDRSPVSGKPRVTPLPGPAESIEE